MINAQQERLNAIYFSDDGNRYAVKLSSSHAIAGGFTVGFLDPDISQKPRAMRMRTLTMRNMFTGQFMQLPIAHNDVPLWDLGGEYLGSINGRSGWLVVERNREHP